MSGGGDGAMGARWLAYSSNKYLQSSMQMWGLNRFEKQRGYRTEKDGTKCTMLIEVWSNFMEKEGKHGKRLGLNGKEHYRARGLEVQKTMKIRT